MTVETTLARVAAIRRAEADPAALVGGRTALTGGTEAPAAGAAAPANSFAAALTQAGTAAAATPAAAAASAMPAWGVPSLQAPAGLAGQRIVAAAEGQLGQAEQPPGSNESPAIAEYRAATAGAVPGAPWCAYFASWAARAAGEPLGPQGEGLGSVSEIWAWAQSSGRAVANGPGVVPKPGDLIVFGSEHVGIVRGVLPDGRIATIEGNYENKVAANVRSPAEATGYVSMS